MSDVPATLISDLQSAVCDVRRYEPIAPHTTVQVGGPAAVMAFPRNANELAAALQVLRRAEGEVEWFAMGGGANLFADSSGYPGIVLNLRGWGWDFAMEDGVALVGGGLDMQAVAEAAARHGWRGIDYMAVVPGTVGGAVVINAGTHSEGGFVEDRFLWAETLTANGASKRYDRAEMQFGYRMSRLLGGREIVTRAAFRLTRCEETGTTPAGLLEIFENLRAARRVKFPLEYPNFGSTFRSPGAPHPPAGKLIDQLGMKGARAGAARISEKHGNFIVNEGGATSGDVIALMKIMRDAVHERFGVWLRPEVRYLRGLNAPVPDFLND